MKKYTFMIVSLGLIITSIWYKYPIWIKILYGSSTGTIESRALLGDSFGSLNTLFSGLAFAGIIISIFLQSRELKETRAEIKGQKEEFKLQTVAMNKQVFETTFFQLLQLHNEIIQTLKIESGFASTKKEVHGRDSFNILFNEKFIRRNLRSEHDFLYSHEKHVYPENVNGNYLMFHRVYGHLIGHYFRNIYQILKYIDTSTVKDKKFYSNLLRAQMSDFELGLLFYNCLSDLGNTKFKRLIEQYQFFEHLYLLEQIDTNDVLLYDKSAFGTTNLVMLKLYETNT